METKLGVVETRFADIVWENAPLTTLELVAICKEELNWARTTTYTVLKKLCQREIFEMKAGRVTTLVSKEEFYAIRCQQFVMENFQGSLPQFVAAFVARQRLSREDIAQLKNLVNSIGE